MHLVAKNQMRTNDNVPVETAGKREGKGLSVIAIAYIITVPLLIVVSIAVNFVCYKCGFKKGKAVERKRQFPDDAQVVHYQHYQDDDESVGQRPAREQPGPSAGQLSTDASHDYAAYDEIKDHRQRMQASQRKKDGGYLTPVSQNLNRSLPPARTDGDGYMSPTSASDNRPPGEGKRSKDSSPSPPGNGGYISPLQADSAAERMLSGNSDSSSNKSDKSDKSRKYQNQPRSKSSPKSKAIYQSIKDAGISQEHQYLELQTNTA